MKNYVVQPDMVVSITRIPNLEKIEVLADKLTIGANARLDDIESHTAVREQYPALAQAIAHLGTPQIRNQGTLGGNLCQRPSCWYFTQEAFECAKRGGASCPAREGENEFHAIFGNDGPCVMAHPSSVAPALIVLGAVVRVTGPGGAKEVSIEKFFVTPKEDVRKETILAPNEIVTHVSLGPPRPHSATYEVRQKEADWPVTAASVALEMAGGACTDARIGLGFVAPVPWRAAAAEAVLKGKPVNAETAAAAADAAVAGAKPLSQNAHKVAAARTAVKRAILLAATGKWS
jgi:xanthine dehydrogenase YagS FAD-binding subunit